MQIWNIFSLNAEADMYLSTFVSNVNSFYKEMILVWKCNLRHVGSSRQCTSTYVPNFNSFYQITARYMYDRKPYFWPLTDIRDRFFKLYKEQKATTHPNPKLLKHKLLLCSCKDILWTHWIQQRSALIPLCPSRVVGQSQQLRRSH